MLFRSGAGVGSEAGAGVLAGGGLTRDGRLGGGVTQAAKASKHDSVNHRDNRKQIMCVQPCLGTSMHGL